MEDLGTVSVLLGRGDGGLDRKRSHDVGDIATALLDDVNGDQEIEAPAEARPLSELTGSLGGASLLGAVGDQASGTGGGSSGGDSTGVAPVEPNGTGSAPNTPDAEDFKAYADCLD